MAEGGEQVREGHGRALRTSHAKAHGLLRGERGCRRSCGRGRLPRPETIPLWSAFDAEREREIDGDAVLPAHSLAAHRPLGSIMRVRMHAYEELGRNRSELDGRPVGELRGGAARADHLARTS